MKAVIVVGSTSMLGMEVMRQLTNQGVEVIAAGRQASVGIWVDLASDQAPVFHQAYKADAVIHCASAFGGDTLEGVRENFRVNIWGCVSVAEIARKSEAKKIVYAGTVFSDPSFDGDPMGGYGFSKAEAERILAWYINRLGGSFCSLRLSQLWDTEGFCCAHQPWYGRIVAYASRGLVLKMPLSNGVRNFMSVSDAASLLILAAKTSITGIHIAAHPIDTNLVELAKLAYQIFNKGGGVEIDRAKTPFREMRFPKENEVYAKLGFYPSTTPMQGLEKIRDAGTANQFGPIDVQ